jgi:cytochrome c oxidase subunit 4
MITRDPRTPVKWKEPTLIWVILILLVAATYAAAVSEIANAWKTVIHFVVVVAQVTLIGIFFMDLRGAHGLERVVAVAGIYWLIIMFVLTFNDYESRPFGSPCGLPAFTGKGTDECPTLVR